MEQIEPTPEFRKFTLGMYQYIEEHIKDEFEMIEFMISELSNEERASLKRFLTEFLASNSTVEQAEELWNATNPDSGIIGEGLFWFLRETISRL